MIGNKNTNLKLLRSERKDRMEENQNILDIWDETVDSNLILEVIEECEKIIKEEEDSDDQE